MLKNTRNVQYSAECNDPNIHIAFMNRFRFREQYKQRENNGKNIIFRECATGDKCGFLCAMSTLCNSH